MNVTAIVTEAFKGFLLQLEYFAEEVLRTVEYISLQYVRSTSDWNTPIEFTPLQRVLLQVLVFLIVGTSLLIVYSWHRYGKVITEKFVRPSTLKEIEELKRSVANLKLPKEHSPRI